MYREGCQRQLTINYQAGIENAAKFGSRRNHVIQSGNWDGSYQRFIVLKVLILNARSSSSLLHLDRFPYNKPYIQI